MTQHRRRRLRIQQRQVIEHRRRIQLRGDARGAEQGMQGAREEEPA